MYKMHTKPTHFNFSIFYCVIVFLINLRVLLNKIISFKNNKDTTCQSMSTIAQNLVSVLKKQIVAIIEVKQMSAYDCYLVQVPVGSLIY